jgi:hypothetical protein
LGEVVSEADLADLVETQAFGTPAPNLHCLEQMEFSVSYESVTLTTLQSHLEAGVPYLAFVRTGDLPYWNEDTAHELVAIGIDESSIYVNDAAFDEAPQTFPVTVQLVPMLTAEDAEIAEIQITFLIACLA